MDNEMHLVDRQLREFAESHPDLVSVRMSVRHPRLRVVKYKPKVFYKALWTPELCEMRGLVVDEEWNVIVRPFRKIFNRFESGTDFPLDTDVAAARKVNGFMAALTVDDEYGVIVSTTGSLDSPFVTMAEKYLLPLKDSGLINGVTYLFEIVDPEDPHIVEEKVGAYLIGARAVCSKITLLECDLDEIAKGMGVLRPEWKRASFGEIVEETKTCKHEGFVCYNVENGHALKIKSPYYLVKKFFARVRAEKLTADWLQANRHNFDEEFYGLIDYISDNRDQFTTMDQEGRKSFIEHFLSL
jgi:hypothetical protein